MIENGVANVADPSLKDRIAELTSIRDQAVADAERTTSAVERLGPAITPESLRTFVLAAAQASERRWNLSAGPSAGLGSARRGRRSQRGSDNGFKNRAFTNARRCCKRRIGDDWRSQFGTEVARLKRFELLPPRFPASDHGLLVLGG